jgi:CDP-diglyceride synthetase
MAVKCKLRCSECETIRDVELNTEDKEIVCVVCGRRMANLTAEEHSEITQVQSKQRVLAIIALVLLGISVICVYMWAGDTGAWVSGKVMGPDGKIVPASGPIEANQGVFIAFCVTALATFVLSILASMKRHVVEF